MKRVLFIILLCISSIGITACKNQGLQKKTTSENIMTEGASEESHLSIPETENIADEPDGTGRVEESRILSGYRFNG